MLKVGQVRRHSRMNSYFQILELEQNGRCTTALIKNTNSGWVCKAHYLLENQDGTIEWGYSTEGRFAS